MAVRLQQAIHLLDPERYRPGNTIDADAMLELLDPSCPVHVAVETAYCGMWAMVMYCWVVRCLAVSGVVVVADTVALADVLQLALVELDVASPSDGRPMATDLLRVVGPFSPASEVRTAVLDTYREGQARRERDLQACPWELWGLDGHILPT
jgi:hypothetical protein